MNLTLVQEYLRTHSLNQLSAEYGVYSSIKEPLVSRSVDDDGDETRTLVGGSYKFSLNYDQIEAKAGPLTNQCRGLILATVDGHVVKSLDEVIGETVILARPMDRFFNYGDPNASQINFEDPSTHYLEKLDGTLCILYFDTFQNRWHVATRSVPEANLPLDGFMNFTFRKLFELALFDTMTAVGNQGFNITNVFGVYTDKLHPAQTYCFELTTPENRVVVDYKERRLHLLAIRNNETGEQFDGRGDWGTQEMYPAYQGIPVVKKHEIRNVNDLLEFVNSQNPTEHEGVVVCDKHFNRVKVKNAAYLAYNRARDIVGNSPRAMLELILLEKFDDVIPMLPAHLQQRGLEMQEKLAVLIRETDEHFAACKAISELPCENPRKEFCIYANFRGYWLDPLINRFLGKCEHAKDYFKNAKKNPDGSLSTSLLDRILSQLK